MKLRQQVAKLISFVMPIALTASVLTPLRVEAGSRLQFYCARNQQGIITTFARKSNKRIPIISWRSTVGQYTPERRCEEVMRRFQTFSNQGTLRYITTGTINRQNVICVADSTQRSCRPDGLLFTITQSDNPRAVLNQFNGIGTSASGGRGIMETECPLKVDVQDQSYFNIGCYLDSPAAEEPLSGS